MNPNPAITDQLAEALRALYAKAGRVHDFLSDAIEGGRITPADVPDDYEAFVLALEDSVPAHDTAREVLAAYDARRST